MNACRSAQHRAERCAEALGEVEPHAVVLGGDLGSRDAQRHGGVQQPRAVHVRRHAMRVRQLGDRAQLLHRPARSAAAVGGLLHLHQGLRRRIAPAGPDRLGQRRRRRTARAAPRQSAHHHPGDRLAGAALAGDDVALLMREHLVALAAMRGDGDLVGHGAGGQEHRRRLAEQRRDPVAERPHGRVRSRPARRRAARPSSPPSCPARARSGCPTKD